MPARRAAARTSTGRSGAPPVLGTGTDFAGHILALASITLTTGVSTSGSAVALTEAVTMDTNRASACAPTIVPDPGEDDEECDHRKCKCCKHHKDRNHDDDCDNDHRDGHGDGHHGHKGHDGDTTVIATSTAATTIAMTRTGIGTPRIAARATPARAGDDRGLNQSSKVRSSKFEVRGLKRRRNAVVQTSGFRLLPSEF